MSDSTHEYLLGNHQEVVFLLHPFSIICVDTINSNNNIIIINGCLMHAEVHYSVSTLVSVLTLVFLNMKHFCLSVWVDCSIPSFLNAVY